jgi:hypothetical protein
MRGHDLNEVASIFNPSFVHCHLCRSNSLSGAGTTLSRVQTLFPGNGLRLLNDFLALGKNQFDVARIRHVWVDLSGRQ